MRTLFGLDTLLTAVRSVVSQIAQNRVFYAIFRILRFLDYRNVKTNKKNFQTTIIDVKFDEKSKSDFRIGLPCNEKPENHKNLLKNDGRFRKIEEKRLPLFFTPKIFLGSFSFKSKYNIPPLCKVWANSKVVFLRYTFFKNSGVFPIFLLFFAT